MAEPSQPFGQDLRISATDFSYSLRDELRVVVEVRDHTHSSIFSLQDSINMPWTADVEIWADIFDSKLVDYVIKPSYIICRLGNDSQRAVLALKALGVTDGIVKNIDGGFKA